jgi:hypothetical protein
MTAISTGYRVDFRAQSGLALQMDICQQSLFDKIKTGIEVVVKHIDRHKRIYQIGALTLTVLLGAGVETAFAGDPSVAITTVGGGSGIDVGAHRLYARLVSIGKWVIIIKGAFDTISHTVQGDFVQARKSGLSYLIVYVILLGLPWAFNQIEVLFEGM